MSPLSHSLFGVYAQDILRGVKIQTMRPQLKANSFLLE